MEIRMEVPAGMKLVLKPSGDRMLVKVMQMEETTTGGIIVPESRRVQGESDMVWEARVEDVGNGWSGHLGRVVDSPAKVGDMVLVPKASGVAWASLGSSDGYQVVNFDDVLGVIATVPKTQEELDAPKKELAAGRHLAEIRKEFLSTRVGVQDKVKDAREVLLDLVNAPAPYRVPR